MKREMVKAFSGMIHISYASGRNEVERRFPYTNDEYHGLHPHNVDIFEREYCQECRDAASRWWAAKIKAEQPADGKTPEDSQPPH